MIKRILTKMNGLTRMRLVGKTEAGSVEVQPARDSRLNATNCRCGGSNNLPSHLTSCGHNSELCNALKKPNKNSSAKGGYIICQRQEKSQNKKVDLSNSR